MADDPEKNTSDALETTLAATRRKPKRLRAVLIFLAIGIILGGAAWVVPPLIMQSMGSPKPMPPQAEGEAPARLNDLELDIGRITVALAADPTVNSTDLATKSGHHLLIQVTVVLDGARLLNRPDIQNPAHYRDLFIEYLSQLDLDQVRGSAGLARIRGELLRRARVVAGDETAKMVLIQDYMAQ